jgi:hypothetical protein
LKKRNQNLLQHLNRNRLILSRTLKKLPSKRNWTGRIKLLLDQYTQIRDYILSKGANHRLTKKYDSFWIGRNTLFLVTIRGTHIRVYGAADPAAYKDSTMNVYDDSKVKAYQGTPAYIKVVGDMSFKWALRFIDDVVAKNAPAPAEPVTEAKPAEKPAEEAAKPVESKPEEAKPEDKAAEASNTAADEMIHESASEKAADELINAKINTPKN